MCHIVESVVPIKVAVYLWHQQRKRIIISCFALFSISTFRSTQCKSNGKEHLGGGVSSKIKSRLMRIRILDRGVMLLFYVK